MLHGDGSFSQRRGLKRGASPLREVSKNARPEERDDSWECPQCQNVNFGDRTTCNMRKCGAARPVPTKGGQLDQGWACEECGNMNFADREYCNMRKCNAPRFREPAWVPMPAPVRQIISPVSRDNRWACVECGNMNFADREYCNMRKCNAPRFQDPAWVPMPAPVQQMKSPVSRDDRWACGECGNMNFADREYCNMRKCAAPRFREPAFVPMPAVVQQMVYQVAPRGRSEAKGSKAKAGGKGHVMEDRAMGKSAGKGGDPVGWQCECGNMNFADRAFCNLRKCGKHRVLTDWTCDMCGNANFADRISCNMRKCAAPRQDLDPRAYDELVSKGLAKGSGKR